MTASSTTPATNTSVEDQGEVPLYNKRGITLVRGEGVYLWDSDGNRYLDAMSNYGVNILGHQHAQVDAAVQHQLSTLISCHQSFYNDARANLEAALMAELPANLSHIAFANSGTEANEAAIKFARMASGRQKIVFAEHGYHGRTMGSLSVTGVDKYQQGFGPLVPDCRRVPFNDLDALEEALPNSAAVILEPIQGESGVHSAKPGYLKKVRELCHRKEVLLILDEIQTGMGRTGTLFAFQHQDVIPDILTVSKGLANGLPMGLTITSDRVASAITPGAHGSTFAGNPLCCAAASATLAVVCNQSFLDDVARKGEHFLASLRALAHPLVRDVRGHGLMVAVELKTRVTPCLKSLQTNGILALPAGPRSIRFLPPLIIEEPQLDVVVKGLKLALEEQGAA